MGEIIDSWTSEEIRAMHILSNMPEFAELRPGTWYCANPKCEKYCDTVFDKNLIRRRFKNGFQGELVKNQIKEYITGIYCYSCRNMLTLLKKESNIERGSSSAVAARG